MQGNVFITLNALLFCALTLPALADTKIKDLKVDHIGPPISVTVRIMDDGLAHHKGPYTTSIYARADSNSQWTLLTSYPSQLPANGETSFSITALNNTTLAYIAMNKYWEARAEVKDAGGTVLSQETVPSDDNGATR